MWCKHQPSVLTIWGNGSTFDNVILRSAFAAAGLEYPVRFWADQCYRTKKNEFPTVPLVREGTHHKALDDAISQAKHLQAIWRSEDQTPLRDMLERAQQQFTSTPRTIARRARPRPTRRPRSTKDSRSTSAACSMGDRMTIPRLLMPEQRCEEVRRQGDRPAEQPAAVQ
jgi:hypothetical protein